MMNERSHPLAVLLAATIGAAACSTSAPAPAPTSTISASTTSTAAATTPLQTFQSFASRFPRSSRLMNANNTLFASVEFDTPVPVTGATSATDAAMRIIEQSRDLFLPRGTVLRPLRAPDQSQPGARTVHLQQYINGVVPVFGGEVEVEVEASDANVFSIASVDNTVAVVSDMNTTPTITAAQAAQLALAEFAKSPDAARGPASAGTPQLFVFDPTKLGLEGPAVLSWRVDVGSFRVFIDAANGTIVHRYRNAPSISRSVFECEQKPRCRPAFVDTKPQPMPSTAVGDTVELEASTLAAYDYYLRTFQRDGFEGGTVPVRTPINAYSLYWDPEAQYDPTARQLLFSTGWVHRDIVAHEYTHAVLYRGPGIIYSDEPGAVQEFFADVFAAMIDASGTTRWTIGERLMTSQRVVPLRHLGKPGHGGFKPSLAYNSLTNAGQPSHYGARVRRTDPICKTAIPYEDNGCVHFNGAILSLAAVLAVEGESGHPGLGPRKFEQIAYATMINSKSAPLLKYVAGKELAHCGAFAAKGTHGITAGDCGVLEWSLKTVGLR